MKKILVIQLLRFGDLLQSTPALSALRRTWPDAKLSVLVREEFAEVLYGNPDVDEIIEWDLDVDYRGVVPGSPGAGRTAAALRRFLLPLRARKFDLVCNLTNDLPSALVAYLLRPRHVRGLAYCRDRRYRVRDEWLRYLFLLNEVRPLNTVNVVDCFVRACGGTHGGRPSIRISRADERSAAEILRRTLRPSGRPLIGIQTGASKGFKCWPATRYAQLADRLIRAGHDILFFGSDAERDGVGRILQSMSAPKGRAVGLAGETRFPELGALLSKCRLLVSNDTATVHVAAAVGTPCLVLTFGPTGPFETGPYGEGHFSLVPRSACHPCDWTGRCEAMPCRDLLTTDAVFASVECAQTDGRSVPSALQSDDVILYRSERMPDGLLGLRPVNRPTPAFRDILRFVFRTHFMRPWIGRRAEAEVLEWRSWLDEIHAWYDVRDDKALRDAIEAAVADMASLRTLAELGIRAAGAVADHSMALENGTKTSAALARAIGKLERRVLAAEQNGVLRLLVAGFRHNLRDMESLPLRQEAVAHRWNYHKLAQGCAFVAGALREFARSLDGPPQRIKDTSHHARQDMPTPIPV